jgi:uncharacterized membrane protein YedE/YeeE
MPRRYAGSGGRAVKLWNTAAMALEVLAPLAGGALIGAAASLLLIASGQIAGISGILGDLMVHRGGRRWRLAFVAAMLATGALAAALWPRAIGTPAAPTPAIVVAGLLVGFGTRLGGGCTSGHGVCGLSRRSGRSLVATLTFIAAGVLTVAVVRALGGTP